MLPKNSYMKASKQLYLEALSSLQNSAYRPGISFVNINVDYLSKLN